MTAPRWPQNTHRTLIVGRTGSGKSMLGLWLLSTRNFHQMPWVIVDYKRDKFIREIQEKGAVLLEPGSDGKWTAPVAPGLYIIRPDPKEPEAMDDFLYQVWVNTNTGLFFDEGFMVPQKRPWKSFDNILTQGRSMEIPVIMCYQRPVDMSQFATSQSDFFGVFHVLKEDDRKSLDGYLGQGVAPDGTLLNVHTKLPKHWSLWYDVEEDRMSVLQPCPPPPAILEAFGARLQPPSSDVERETVATIEGPRFV